MAGHENATAISRPAYDSAWTGSAFTYHSRDHVTQQSAGDLRAQNMAGLRYRSPGREKHCDGYSFHYGGLAIQDLADARMLLNLARQRGIGVELPLV